MFIPDTPILTADKDELGRAEFAHKLGETIRDWNHEESIAIALYGPWGSGKTSILNMAIEHIEKSTQDRPIAKRPIIIRFNPWNFSEQNQLLQAFFQQLYAEIRKSAPDKEKEFKDLLDKFAKTLGALEDIPSVGGILGGISKVIKVMTPEETLENLKAGLAKSFRALNRRIVIALDDIDRLTQQEIRQLFQLIKVNADFPYTIYLMAFDRSVVEQALTTEQGVSGRAYLEKIVQVGFDVPPIDRAYVEQMLVAELDKILSGISLEHFDNVRWGNLYHAGFKSLFVTIRDVKRYINSLAFNLRIVFSEVNPIDFIGLEALRVFEPDVYEGIADNKALFCSARFPAMGMSTGQDNVKTEYEQIFAEAEARSAVVRNICEQLFPQMKTAYSNTFYGPEWSKTWRKERRICSEDVFDVYFLLGTPKGDVSSAELEQITLQCEDPGTLLTTLEQFVKDERIVRLLDLLGDRIDGLTEAKALGLCEALIALGERLPDQRRSLFAIGTDLQISLLIHWAFKKVNEAKRCEWFQKQIAEGSNLFMPVYVVAVDEPREDKQREDPLFSEECLAELKTTCLAKIAAFAQEGKLTSVKSLSFVLFRWREWAEDQQQLQQFIEHRVSTQDGFLDLVSAFLYKVRSQTAGDYVLKETWRLNLQNLAQFVPIDKLESLASSVTERDIANVPDPSRQALTVLVNTLKNKDAHGDQDDDEAD
jgi:predicted KAP-like P-loop ATPase